MSHFSCQFAFCVVSKVNRTNLQEFCYESLHEQYIYLLSELKKLLEYRGNIFLIREQRITLASRQTSPKLHFLCLNKQNIFLTRNETSRWQAGKTFSWWWRSQRLLGREPGAGFSLWWRTWPRDCLVSCTHCSEYNKAWSWHSERIARCTSLSLNREPLPQNIWRLIISGTWHLETCTQLGRKWFALVFLRWYHFSVFLHLSLLLFSSLFVCMYFFLPFFLSKRFF